MLEKPEYAQWQVTAIIDDGKWSWYVLYITWCHLDQVKAGLHYFGPNSEKTKENIHHRFDIPVVNEDTKDEFLFNVESCRTNTEELRQMIYETDEEDKYGFYPTILIDFDTTTFSAIFVILFSENSVSVCGRIIFLTFLQFSKAPSSIFSVPSSTV